MISYFILYTHSISTYNRDYKFLRMFSIYAALAISIDHPVKFAHVQNKEQKIKLIVQGIIFMSP